METAWIIILGFSHLVVIIGVLGLAYAHVRVSHNMFSLLNKTYSILDNTLAIWKAIMPLPLPHPHQPEFPPEGTEGGSNNDDAGDDHHQPPPPPPPPGAPLELLDCAHTWTWTGSNRYQYRARCIRCNYIWRRARALNGEFLAVDMADAE